MPAAVVPPPDVEPSVVVDELVAVLSEVAEDAWPSDASRLHAVPAAAKRITRSNRESLIESCTVEPSRGRAVTIVAPDRIERRVELFAGNRARIGSVRNTRIFNDHLVDTGLAVNTVSTLSSRSDHAMVVAEIELAKITPA